jgi:hypothetical protein
MQGLAGLTQAIMQYKQSGKNKKQQTIRRGTVSGGLVYIDGRGYVYTVAVDINVTDGMPVWCEIAGTQAVIVGA